MLIYRVSPAVRCSVLFLIAIAGFPSVGTQTSLESKIIAPVKYIAEGGDTSNDLIERQVAVSLFACVRYSLDNYTLRHGWDWHSRNL